MKNKLPENITIDVLFKSNSPILDSKIAAFLTKTLIGAGAEVFVNPDLNKEPVPTEKVSLKGVKVNFVRGRLLYPGETV